jgi:predicted DNA-binding transcriptional regulator YafY
MSDQQLLTAAELAQRLNVSVAVVYRNGSTWPS